MAGGAEVSHATALVKEAAQMLRRSARELPGRWARERLTDLAGQAEDMIPAMRDAESGKTYECRCCHAVSETPWGAFDKYKCPSCFNGCCAGHARVE